MTTGRKRVMGLDLGERRIGIALSDALRVTAQPLTVLERREAAVDLRAIAALAVTHDVERIIVGLPLMMNGTRGEQAQRVTAFVEALRRQVSCAIELLDERLTTVQGERSLIAMDVSRRKRKHVIDQVAAQLILQDYLDRHANRPN